MLQSSARGKAMHVPETPTDVQELDLMKLLNAYAEGRATWLPGQSPVDSGLRESCRILHTQLIELTTRLFSLILDRVNAREMEIFTLHNRHHGMKVAHLMWQI